MFEYFYHSSPSLLSVVGLSLTAFTLDATSEIVDRIYPQSNKFATGVENKATGDSKLNYNPDLPLHFPNKVFNLDCRLIGVKWGFCFRIYLTIILRL